ncbi:hypothetical protein [Garicola koreensis]|uniref:Uncharacterized protein n=1 Tax=Garicola koreensis TaxID=1262554 RepID=A0A7W5TRU5_9MICC|nr:hypothetical protein [Garicola koreensis]MBB3666573.1 hypothetical protein [Garicola koreensis]
MRNLFSVLCLLLAGLLSTAALAGHQIDQLLRAEEPVRELAGSLPNDEAFSEAVTETIVDDAVARLPEGLQQFVPGSVDALVRPVISSALDTERTAEAWDEVIQDTRSDYTAHLEDMFHRGTTGDVRELDIAVDLTPVTEAMTQPVRQGVEDTVSLIPGVEAEDVEIPAPSLQIDVEAATDESADPYTWATAAGLSQHWLIFGVGAAALGVLGVLLGTRRVRWYALATAAALAGVIGLWVATTVAAPSLAHQPGTPEATTVLLEHIQVRFTDWAQPSWWVFTGAAGFVVVLSVLAAVVTPARREQG